MVKVDPYNLKEKYGRWRDNCLDNGIPGLSEINSQIILQYLLDMERGLNVAISNKKGARSHIRLNAISIRLVYLAKEFQKRYSVDLTEITEDQVSSFFADMRNGTIRKNNGGIFTGVAFYVKDFKAFWHWHQKVNRKIGVDIRDITQELDTSHDKPDWVYLTEDQIKLLCSQSDYKYEVLIWFLFDTGIRAPTELANVKVSDFFNDFKELQIREEASKTFGRRIKLMLCSEIIKEYVRRNKLMPENYLFKVSPGTINRYLKRLGKRVLGDKESPAGQKYSQLTMYDFRHNSCCYWLPRYKSESALKYRFGWKKSDKIHYYSEMLGMRDTISEDDMLVDVTKTEIEKRLQRSEKEKEILQDEVKDLRLQVATIGKLTNRLYSMIKPGSAEAEGEETIIRIV